MEAQGAGTGAREVLLDRRFLALFAAQFCGAANDNLLKAATGLLLVFAADPQEGAALATLAGLLLMLPFLLASPLAGELADRFPKPSLLRITKAAEVGLALAALLLLPLREPLPLLAVVFLMGLQSTFFGPLKYGLPAEWYDGPRLLLANGLIQGSTFLAILLGTLAGSLLAATAGARAVGTATLALALIGFLPTLLVPPQPAADPALRLHANPLPAHRALLRWLRAHPRLWRLVLALSWFWGLGAVWLAQVPAYAREVFAADEREAAALLAAFVVGIAAGALVAGRVAGPRIGTAHAAPAMAVVAAAGLDLTLALGAPAPGAALLASWSGWRLLVDLAVLAFAGGLYAVPLLTRLLADTPATHRGRVVAANNVVNAVLIVAVSALATVLPPLLGSVRIVLLLAALAAGALALWLWWRPPVAAPLAAGGGTDREAA